LIGLWEYAYLLFSGGVTPGDLSCREIMGSLLIFIGMHTPVLIATTRPAQWIKGVLFGPVIGMAVFYIWSLTEGFFLPSVMGALIHFMALYLLFK
jgi:hypothetical protein